MGGLGGLLRWYNCIGMSFLFKKVLGAEKNLIYYTHSTRCSLAVVTRDSTISVQFKTICDAWREHLVEMVQYLKHTPGLFQPLLHLTSFSCSSVSRDGSSNVHPFWWVGYFFACWLFMAPHQGKKKVYVVCTSYTLPPLFWQYTQ